MALTVENGQEAPQECSICFEKVLAVKRTLVCRHVLCQDCLSEILVVAQSQGSIVCPLCHHPTVPNEQKKADETLAGDEGHTQEALLPLPMRYFQIAPSTGGLWHPGNWMSPYLTGISQQGTEQTVTACGSHIFTRNSQGKPTTDGDTTVNITEDDAPGCTTYQLTCGGLIFLLVMIFLVTMTWLVQRQYSGSADFSNFSSLPPFCCVAL